VRTRRRRRRLQRTILLQTKLLTLATTTKPRKRRRRKPPIRFKTTTFTFACSSVTGGRIGPPCRCVDCRVSFRFVLISRDVYEVTDETFTRVACFLNGFRVSIRRSTRRSFLRNAKRSLTATAASSKIRSTAILFSFKETSASLWHSFSPKKKLRKRRSSRFTVPFESVTREGNESRRC